MTSLFQSTLKFKNDKVLLLLTRCPVFFSKSQVSVSSKNWRKVKASEQLFIFLTVARDIYSRLVQPDQKKKSCSKKYIEFKFAILGVELDWKLDIFTSIKSIKSIQSLTLIYSSILQTFHIAGKSPFSNCFSSFTKYVKIDWIYFLQRTLLNSSPHRRFLPKKIKIISKEIFDRIQSLPKF